LLIFDTSRKLIRFAEFLEAEREVEAKKYQKNENTLLILCFLAFLGQAREKIQK